MSEYQYYEFLALDRPLTQDEMAELRRLSTRAEITPTSFTNEYHWGDFKGRPYELVKKYFDAFVYVANWGTRRFMFRVPRGAVDADALAEYQAEQILDVGIADEQLIVDIWCDDESGGDWVEGSGWMAALSSLRQDVLRGDWRCLYVGWLRGVWTGFAADEDIEPPVPDGLADLSGPLSALVEFLEVDEDLLTVAAEASAPLGEMEDDSAALSEWVCGLPPDEKDTLLVSLVREERPGLRWELLRRFRRAGGPCEAMTKAPNRTAGQLLARAEVVREARLQAERERLAARRAQRQREEAEARQRYLDGLVGRESMLWSKAELLIKTKQPNKYDQAVVLIGDLRDLADRQGANDAFTRRLFTLREQHHRKASFLRRLDKAGLA